MSERGLVISVPLEISGHSLQIKSTELDLQELRFSLLFWDRLDFPSNNLISIPLGPDAQFLADSGILNRTKVTVVGQFDLAGAFAQAHVHAFRMLNEGEPGVWSLATGENSFSFQPEDLEEGRGVLVRIHRAIPVPDKDVPLQDILEFRAKRRDELVALRHHLEVIYQQVIDAGDRPMALSTEVERLQLAIADHIRASREAKFPLRLADIGAELNLLGPLTAAVTAWHWGLPMLDSLITGAAASLTANVGVALKRHKANATPFRYISSYHRDLF